MRRVLSGLKGFVSGFVRFDRFCIEGFGQVWPDLRPYCQVLVDVLVQFWPGFENVKTAKQEDGVKANFGDSSPGF